MVWDLLVPLASNFLLINYPNVITKKIFQFAQTTKIIRGKFKYERNKSLSLHNEKISRQPHILKQLTLQTRWKSRHALMHRLSGPVKQRKHVISQIEI